jgi:hypothetical protein
MMDAEAIVTITTAVVICTQLCKTAAPETRYGLAIAALNTVIGLTLWEVSQVDLPTRLDIWGVALAFVTILSAASGVYGLAVAATKALVAHHVAAAAVRRPTSHRPRRKLRQVRPDPATVAAGSGRRVAP